MKKGMSVLLGLGLLAVAGTAQADVVGLSQISMAGTGCPQGTAGVSNVAINGGSTEFTLQFDQYAPELAAGSSAALARKNCAIAFPLDLPPGTRAVIRYASARGWAAVPKGSSGVIALEAFEPGVQMPVIEKTLKGGFSNGGTDFRKDFGSLGAPLYRTACGQTSTILRLNTSARAIAKGKHRDTLLQIDELDFAIDVEPCQP